MSGKNQVTCARMTSQDGRSRALRLVRRVFAKPARSLAMLPAIGLVSGVAPQAATAAEADHIFSVCTFTTSSIRSALTITDPDLDLSTSTLEASYILIYVRANPNDGQQIGTTATY